MAQPPIKTTAEDINALTGYLRNQVGWVEIAKVKKAIPAQYLDNRKLEAMRYLGLLERDAGNIKLTAAGRRYAEATSDDERATALRDQLRSVPLYDQTLQWMHYNKKTSPTKTDVANYWHDNHAEAIGDAKGAALTDAAIFFLRTASLAGIGQFVAAGGGRDTHIKVNGSALASYVTNTQAAMAPGSPTAAAPATAPAAAPAGAPAAPTVSVGAGLHVNIEIHIAADAEPSTIEEIFRNMRRYILGEGGDGEGK